jgi:hypothetical protein
MKNVKSYIALFLLIFVGAIIFSAFTGCRTPQQRHDHLVTRFGDMCSVDTVLVKDTIIKVNKVPVPERRDSFIITTDTIIETEMFIIERDGDRFNVTAKRDTITFRDTIPYEVKVARKIPLIKESKFEVMFDILISILAFFMGFFVSRGIYKD